ncbi:MAG: hypothetical protein KatS3mg111_0431 [Pirellulaceae bacterium]|nr:MAG: hypothetical protein KatS3mg111_0431 [Pirellulaceae bacterium]
MSQVEILEGTLGNERVDQWDAPILLTDEEIMARVAAIKATWSPAEHRRRRKMGARRREQLMQILDAPVPPKIGLGVFSA